MDIGINCVKMEKQDLTMYGEQELSLIVMNDEPLYKVMMASVRMGKFDYILDHVSDLFTFTEEQADDLRETWEDEILEQENESLSLSTESEASRPKRIEDNKELSEKILVALNNWANHFKILGSPEDTPRYSQLLTPMDGDTFELQSTQRSSLRCSIKGLTDEENTFLKRMDSNDRWEQYRDMRNKFLAENHPTIDLN